MLDGSYQNCTGHMEGDKESQYRGRDGVWFRQHGGDGGTIPSGTLQAHQAMDDFLWKQLFQHPEVASYITLYLFGHIDPRFEVSYLKHRLEAQDKTLNKMQNTCRELRAIMDQMTEKANRISKKQDKRNGEWRYEGILNKKDLGDQMNDKDKTSEEVYNGDVDGERYS